MAYININTFDILECPLKENIEDYFECDEFIAPIISLLNKKGYKTRFCCEGHLYDDEIVSRYTFKDNGRPNENTILGYIHHEIIEDGLESKYLVYSRHSNLDGYINFEPYVDFGHFLDTFPKTGVYPFYHNNTIFWNYLDEKNKTISEIRKEEINIQAKPYMFFDKKIKFLTDVYEWVKSLPDYETCISDEKKKEIVFMVNDIPRIKKILETKVRNLEPIDDLFHVFFMNAKLISNMLCSYDEMLTLNLDEKVEFFVDLYNKMVRIDDDGNWSILIETKRIKN